MLVWGCFPKAQMIQYGMPLLLLLELVEVCWCLDLQLVLLMGMEKINFFWYFRKISILAFVGFLTGYLTFMLMRDFILI